MTLAETPKVVPHGPQIWPLSVPAYHVLGDIGLVPKRTELLYGQVWYKKPKPPIHCHLAHVLFNSLCSVEKLGLYVSSGQTITCEDSELEPDLAVICGSFEDFRYSHPTTAELVIEICVSSYEYDRSKLRAYANAGVKECWLMLGPEKQIEVHRQPQGEQYTEHSMHGPGGSVTSTVVANFTADLASLFAV